MGAWGRSKRWAVFDQRLAWRVYRDPVDITSVGEPAGISKSKYRHPVSGVCIKRTDLYSSITARAVL